MLKELQDLYKGYTYTTVMLTVFAFFGILLISACFFGCCGSCCKKKQIETKSHWNDEETGRNKDNPSDFHSSKSNNAVNETKAIKINTKMEGTSVHGMSLRSPSRSKQDRQAIIN